MATITGNGFALLLCQNWLKPLSNCGKFFSNSGNLAKYPLGQMVKPLFLLTEGLTKTSVLAWLENPTALVKKKAGY